MKKKVLRIILIVIGVLVVGSSIFFIFVDDKEKNSGNSEKQAESDNKDIYDPNIGVEVEKTIKTLTFYEDEDYYYLEEEVDKDYLDDYEKHEVNCVSENCTFLLDSWDNLIASNPFVVIVEDGKTLLYDYINHKRFSFSNTDTETKIEGIYAVRNYSEEVLPYVVYYDTAYNIYSINSEKTTLTLDRGIYVSNTSSNGAYIYSIFGNSIILGKEVNEDSFEQNYGILDLSTSVITNKIQYSDIYCEKIENEKSLCILESNTKSKLYYYDESQKNKKLIGDVDEFFQIYELYASSSQTDSNWEKYKYYIFINVDNELRLYSLIDEKVIFNFSNVDLEQVSFVMNTINKYLPYVFVEDNGSLKLYSFSDNKFIGTYDKSLYDSYYYDDYDFKSVIPIFDSYVAVYSDDEIYYLLDLSTGKIDDSKKYDDIYCEILNSSGTSDKNVCVMSIVDGKDEIYYYDVKANVKEKIGTFDSVYKIVVPYRDLDIDYKSDLYYAFVEIDEDLILYDLKNKKQIKVFEDFDTNYTFYTSLLWDSLVSEMFFFIPDSDLCHIYSYNFDTGESESRVSGCVGDAAKPVIYLYPEEKTNVTVTFKNRDLLTTTYPKLIDKWEVVAYPNGDLYDLKNQYYYALYWEGKQTYTVNFDEGFYVEKDDAIVFLEEKLKKIGLSDRERNEFIMYWLPVLEKNEKSLVYFELTEELQKRNELIINPNPDSLLRVLMHVKKVDKKVSIKEQKLPTFNRKGFVVLEWGGTVYEDGTKYTK